MRISLILVFTTLLTALPAALMADELTQMAQQELMALGYDVDNTEGELTTRTIVAISKFQAENNMEVTGEASPQLIGVLRAAQKKSNEPTAQSMANQNTANSASAAAQSQQTLQQLQQACLQEKYAAAQASKKKKMGLKRLFNAVGKVSSKFGGGKLAGDIHKASSTAYDVDATASDLQAAGQELGLTPDQMEECRNPM